MLDQLLQQLESLLPDYLDGIRAMTLYSQTFTAAAGTLNGAAVDLQAATAGLEQVTKNLLAITAPTFDAAGNPTDPFAAAADKLSKAADKLLAGPGGSTSPRPAGSGPMSGGGMGVTNGILNGILAALMGRHGGRTAAHLSQSMRSADAVLRHKFTRKHIRAGLKALPSKGLGQRMRAGYEWWLKSRGVGSRGGRGRSGGGGWPGGSGAAAGGGAGAGGGGSLSGAIDAGIRAVGGAFGPAGAVAAEAAVALKNLSLAAISVVPAFANFSRELLESQRHLAQFNAAHASIQANVAYRDILRNQASGERTAGTAATLAVGDSDLQDELRRWGDVWTNMRNEFTGNTDSGLAYVLKSPPVQMILRYLEKIAGNTERPLPSGVDDWFEVVSERVDTARQRDPSQWNRQ